MNEDLIHKLMSELHIPGMALGIQQGNSHLHEGYYGLANVEHGVAVTANAVFEIASVTKLFTTQAILRLIQDGKLNFDDRLVAYLPNLPMGWESVTILHCLTHHQVFRATQR